MDGVPNPQGGMKTQFPGFVTRLTHVLSSAFLLLAANPALAQGSRFAYQGRLTEAANPANGTFEMQFKLFDPPNVGTGIRPDTERTGHGRKGPDQPSQRGQPTRAILPLEVWP